MTYKISWIFDYINADQKAAGWSETWYTGDGHGADDVIAQCKLWAQARSGLLGNATKILGFRIQRLGRKAQMIFAEYPGTLGTNQDIPQMALECKAYSGNTDNVKYFQFRGVPDALVTSGKYTPSLAFTANLNTLGTFMTNLFGFQCQDQTAVPADVVSIDGVGNIVLAGAGLPFDLTKKYTLLRAKTVLGANASGTYALQAFTDNNHAHLYGYDKGPVARPCKLRPQILIYPTIAGKLVPVQISTRKVGRPFFQYRGRRQKR